jgi:uncharacterized OB-fold protein
VTTDATSTELFEQLKAHIGAEGPPTVAHHPVNEPTITTWCDAMGDGNPCYTDPEFAAKSVHGGIVAPPAMLDVWDAHGLKFRRRPDLPRAKVLNLLDRNGFISTVAVNSELDIFRYVRPGELLQNIEVLDDVSPEKTTALGVGHFVTTRHRYTTADGEPVGELLFRILKFKPGTGRTAAPAEGGRTGPDPNPALRPRPAINRDNQFFWDGARAHELRIQECTACHARFSPPTPRCSQCGSLELGFVVSEGRGHLYSYAIPHYPQANGFRYPVPVGLVELDEGTRLVSNIVGCPRDRLRIGMPLELEWLDSHSAQVDGATDARGPISLPQFRPAVPTRRETTVRAGDVQVGDELPVHAMPITPTLIVSGAIATRDYTAVHHDRDHAIRLGSKDIFMNILTSTGLMQRYVSDWVGPEAIVRALRVRLGAPNYPGDMMALTGSVTACDAATGAITVAVRGSNDLGDHINGTVELTVGV